MAYSLTEILAGAGDQGIEVLFVPIKSQEAKEKQGIHIVSPTFHELSDAIESAMRDGFCRIYIHCQF